MDDLYQYGLSNRALWALTVNCPAQLVGEEKNDADIAALMHLDGGPG